MTVFAGRPEVLVRRSAIADWLWCIMLLQVNTKEGTCHMFGAVCLAHLKGRCAAALPLDRCGASCRCIRMSHELLTASWWAGVKWKSAAAPPLPPPGCGVSLIWRMECIIRDHMCLLLLSSKPVN